MQALINDLDLTAKQGSTSYYANGQSSTSGYNAYNNVEQVGPYVVMPDLSPHASDSSEGAAGA